MRSSLHKIKKTLITLLFLVTFVVGSLAIAPATYAQASGGATNTWTGECVYDSDVPTIIGVECLLANVLGVAVTFIGLAGFVMLLYGSYKFLISGGNNKGMEDAQKTLTFSVIGLVVALSAFLIVRLIAEFTGVNSILNFSIRVP
jgi:hypothetical protein